MIFFRHKYSLIYNNTLVHYHTDHWLIWKWKKETNTNILFQLVCQYDYFFISSVHSCIRKLIDRNNQEEHETGIFCEIIYEVISNRWMIKTNFCCVCVFFFLSHSSFSSSSEISWKQKPDETHWKCVLNSFDMLHYNHKYANIVLVFYRFLINHTNDATTIITDPFISKIIIIMILLTL